MNSAHIQPNDDRPIDRDAPLLLSIAAARAFPDGSMTKSGLRRGAARGRLTVERIAGEDYTTLAAIDRMRELCRRPAAAAASVTVHDLAMAGRSAPSPNSSRAAVETSRARASLDATLEALRKRPAGKSL